MAWHGSNDFAEKAPTAPVSKSPRDLDEVRDLCKKALMASGYNESDSEIVTDCLMYAELRGNNQGMNRNTFDEGYIYDLYITNPSSLYYNNPIPPSIVPKN